MKEESVLEMKVEAALEGEGSDVIGSAAEEERRGDGDAIVKGENAMETGKINSCEGKVSSYLHTTRVRNIKEMKCLCTFVSTK